LHINSTICGISQGKKFTGVFDRYANLKYKYVSRQFWCREYYVDTVGRNKRVIEEYIKNQLEALSRLPNKFEGVHSDVYGC